MEALNSTAFILEPSPAGGGPSTVPFSTSIVTLMPPMAEPKFRDLLSESLMIVEDPSICGGAPTLRGTRISVHLLIGQMRALGWTRERVLESYPHLTLDQIDGACRFYEAHRAMIDDLIKREDAAGV